MASQRAPSTSMLATAWCDRLNQFCMQLQKNCSSLHNIVQRKPEPQSRDDNFDIFLEDLNEDISSALAELQHLEERTTDTLSFEELLVHCDAFYESNEDGITKLELQLQQYGYTPVEMPKQIHTEVLHGHTHQEIETNSNILDEVVSPPRSGFTAPLINENETSIMTPVALSYTAKNSKRDVEYSPLFGDLGDLENLESLGISATSLTALASQDEPVSSVHPLQHKLTFLESPKNNAKIRMRDSEMEDNLKTKSGSHRPSEADVKHLPLPSTSDSMVDSTYGYDSIPVVFNKPVHEFGIGSTNSATTTTFSRRDETVQSLETKNVPDLTEISSVQYDSLPIWLRSQVSLQELNGAVAKINELIRQRSVGGQQANQYFLDQKDVQVLGLGSKARAGIMLLTKADKIVTQNINGVTTYRICL